MNRENHRRLEKFYRIYDQNADLFDRASAQTRFNPISIDHQNVVAAVRSMYSAKTASCDIYRTQIMKYLSRKEYGKIKK